ncbi:MAG TPA: hypothetical protein ENK85_07870 [Saprospiraceae bacterium]|nr:hypothetical protein [Saprospiraceae bacterium]
MKRYILGILWVSTVMISSCYYDNEETLYPQVRTCVTDSMSYAGDILPILDNSCLSCHSAAANQGGVTIEGYTSVKTYVDNDLLLKSIKHESGVSPMPKNADQLDSCTIAKVEAWILQGALNN